MISPEQISDAFDRMDEANKREIESGLKGAVYSTGTKHGVDDWRTVGVAVGAGLLEATYNFLSMSGRGLVDVLRLGETIRKPSAGAVFRDGLRILTIVPLARVLKTGTISLGMRAAVGGEMSCVVTGNTVAARMSGTRLGITLEELWYNANAAGKVNPSAPSLRAMHPLLSPAHPTFEGLKNLRALVPELEAMGAAIESPSLTSIDDVARLAAQGRGPVPFGVAYVNSVSRVPLPIPKHMMVAFRSVRGEIMIADQGGVKTLASMMANELAGGRGVAVVGGYLVRHARWINDAAALQRALLFGRGLPGALVSPSTPINVPVNRIAQSDAEQSWFYRGIEAPLYHLPGPIAFRADMELRRKLRRPPRPPRSGPGPKAPRRHAPPLWDDPNLEGAEPAVRRLWTAMLAQGLSKGNDVSLGALATASGLSSIMFEDALMQLELQYRRIHVLRSGHPEGEGPKVHYTYH